MQAFDMEGWPAMAARETASPGRQVIAVLRGTERTLAQLEAYSP